MYERLRDVFTGLVGIDAPSGEEDRMREYLKGLFSSVGVILQSDEAGNLYGVAEGTGTPLLLSAHMDTVQPARNKKAIVHEDGKITSDGTTVLGADDLSAIAEIYVLLQELKKTGAVHRTIEILISAGEELYAVGAGSFDYTKLRSKEAYVLDYSGPVGSAAYAAPTILFFEAEIRGKAAHAGFEPEQGIHSIAAASRAIGRLPLGKIRDGVTGNVGQIQGGTGTNIVPAQTVVTGEIRSMIHEEALKLAGEYQRIFEEEAKSVGANVVWKQKVHTTAYETPLSQQVVRNYVAAVEKCGLVPQLEKTFGGSDNNVFAGKKIHGIVIANSMYQIHTVHEFCNLWEMVQVVEILQALVTL